ncbi:MAG TPA: hypothetical protein PK639_04390 [Candidatus Woesebacteria bacterium]|nr:hypothetical protein [Candidatus Woesebacteria bacterium]
MQTNNPEKKRDLQNVKKAVVEAGKDLVADMFRLGLAFAPVMDGDDKPLPTKEEVKDIIFRK